MVDVDYDELSNDEAGRAAYFGFQTAFPLTMVILSVNFGVILVAFVFFSQQAYEDARMPVLRLSASGQRPRLDLTPGHQWALMLSHQWGNQEYAAGSQILWGRCIALCSGPGMVASFKMGPTPHVAFLVHSVVGLIKRQLQLLLPGVRVFLVSHAVSCEACYRLLLTSRFIDAVHQHNKSSRPHPRRSA